MGEFPGLSVFEVRTIALERAVEYKSEVSYGTQVPLFGIIEVFETYLHAGREAAQAKMEELEESVNSTLVPRGHADTFVG